jgi:flavin-dependent dehydrogenase
VSKIDVKSLFAFTYHLSEEFCGVTQPADANEAIATDCDVLVIGGGPAGATVAALLAQNGRKVVVVEKESFPRFHIGESLLPHNLPLLDRLGIRSQIETIAIRKHGIEFVSPYHGKRVTYDFAKAWNKTLPYSFQVRRSVFDHVLLKNAAAKGAAVIEGCRVMSVDFAGPHPVITGRDSQGQTRQWRAAFVVDASGRDTMLASQLGTKERNPRNSSAAIFAHFTGARRLEGKEEGNISIVWFDNGWFWFIPLADGTTSIGAVCQAPFLKNRGTDLTRFFMDVIASSPEIADRLKDATLCGDVTATGNYSYGAKAASGEKFLLVGDAFSFVDPVFSTGVYLAMTTGFRAAEAVEAYLRAPARSARALKRYNAAVDRALGSFTWFIYRIREPAMRNLFMSPRNVLRIEEAVLSLLAGGIADGWQVRARLMIFRGLYYVTKLSHLRFKLFTPDISRVAAQAEPAGRAGWAKAAE